MKIIFDHSAPAPLARFLAGHTVSICETLGWSRLDNGELLTAAEAAGFDLMITSDQNIKYQQNLAKRRISLIVLGSNDWGIVKRHVNAISASVNAAAPNSYVFVEMPMNRRRPRWFLTLPLFDKG